MIPKFHSLPDHLFVLLAHRIQIKQTIHSVYTNALASMHPDALVCHTHLSIFLFCYVFFVMLFDKLSVIYIILHIGNQFNPLKEQFKILHRSKFKFKIQFCLTQQKLTRKKLFLGGTSWSSGSERVLYANTFRVRFFYCKKTNLHCSSYHGYRSIRLNIQEKVCCRLYLLSRNQVYIYNRSELNFFFRKKKMFSFSS